MAFLGISMHFFKKYITSMSGMWFLLFVQSLFQFGAKEGKWLAITEKKIILTCPKFLYLFHAETAKKKKTQYFYWKLEKKILFLQRNYKIDELIILKQKNKAKESVAVNIIKYYFLVLCLLA